MPITSKDGFKGNSDTATKLTTPRSINGTNFDGTANITTANWGTARTLTVGNTGKSVNGTGNVSWSLSEIGAAAINHGNHVPTTQTANSRVFLRNDNTWQSLPTASTSATGIVQLNNAINSTSTTQAATANAVKIAYDKGIEAINKANQAFQSASNGKNIIAQAITGKGISASGSETFDSLASKINNINTGKKWAKGQVKPLSNLIATPLYINDVQLYLLCVEVSGLTFKPSIIIITGADTGNPGMIETMFSLYYSESVYEKMKFLCDISYDNIESVSIGNYTTYINNTGFRIPLYGTGDSSCSNNRLYDWIAIE